MLDLLRIPEVHISKFGPETGYPDVFVVFLSPPSTCGARTFQIISKWLSIGLPLVACNIMNSKIKRNKTNPAALENAM
jgi:hypothetical protein